jgi:hypothetical protein
MSARNGAAKKLKLSDARDLTPPKRNGRPTLPFRIVVNTDPRMDLSRRMTGSNIDPRRDFSQDCGWPERIKIKDYFNMDERNDYANRVNRVYADECWAMTPGIYETEKVRNTAFEKAVLKYTEYDDEGNAVDPETNLIHYWHKLDVACGIARFGVLLLGINDGKKLSEPADGIDEFGRPTDARPEGREILFLRALDERHIKIKSRVDDINSPRHGKPDMYTLRLANLSLDSDIVDSETKTRDHDVHWSRVIHAAEGGEVMGVPRTKVVFNRLLDVIKILGGGAEMFYQGGFPGLAFTLDPRMLEAGLPDIEEDTLDEQMYLYANHLQRWLNLVGYEAKSLAPNIADPQGNLSGQLQAIATAIGVPLRIFLGAEQAQLASGQDVRTWNRRLVRRLMRFITPILIRPTIDRLVMLGVIPPPKKGIRAYKVVWPDVNMPNPDEDSVVADRHAAAIMKYMQSGAWQMIHPFTFFHRFLKFTADEAHVIVEELKSEPKLELKPVQAITAELAPPPVPGQAGAFGKPGTKPKKTQASGFGDSGTKGRSPSKPPKGGKTQ